MFEHKLRKTWVLLWLAVATVAPASAADGPAAGFKLNREATVFISPDNKVRLEQYAKEQKDGDLLTNSGPLTPITGTLSCSIPANAMIKQVIRLDSDLARTASGWCECKNWGPGLRRSCCIEGRGMNSRPRPQNPLVIWPGIISSRRRHQKGCIGTRRTRMGSITLR